VNPALAPLVPAALAMVTVWALSRAYREVGAWRRQRGLIRRVGVSQPWPEDVADELDLPLLDRIVKPVLRRFAQSLGGRLLPARAQDDLNRKLRLAGMTMPAPVFLVLRWLVAVAMLGLGLFLDAAGVVPLGDQLGVPLGLAVVGYVYWGARLNTRCQQVQQDIERALPEAFDLLSVSVAAGLSFEAALRRAAPRLPGVAGREFGRVVADLEVGLSRLEALMALAERTQVVELSRFASLVAQAERAGAGMSAVLHAQADRVKDLRVQRARERAAMVPVKILFPLVLFILPALFVTILGGGIISMVQAFGGGSL
jgi:tight adherence protein C